MKYRRIIVFSALALLTLIACSGKEKPEAVVQDTKPAMTMIGSGEMKYMCPMAEHNIFSSEPGKCPECGMNLKEMTDNDLKKMHEMMTTHQAVDKSGKKIEHSHDEEHDPGNNTMLLIGEGDMKYACPMHEHKVFSAEPGKCTICGMNLTEMTAADTKWMEELKQDHKEIRHIH